MQLKTKRRRSSASKIKREKSTPGKVRAGGEKSGASVAAERPPATSAQLDARQNAIKPQRKAPGPPRNTKSIANIAPSDVPPVEPRSE